MSLEAFPLFPGIPGGTELAVILLIAILLFGANKIPKLARSTGEAMGEFKKGREEVEKELQEIREGGTSEEVSGDGGTTPQPATEEPVVEETEPAAEPVAEAEPEVETESTEK